MIAFSGKAYDKYFIGTLVVTTSSSPTLLSNKVFESPIPTSTEHESRAIYIKSETSLQVLVKVYDCIYMAEYDLSSGSYVLKNFLPKMASSFYLAHMFFVGDYKYYVTSVGI